MSIAQRIIAALGPNTDIALPCAQGTYDGEEETYLSFQVHFYPQGFADDAAQADRAYIMLHLFAPFTRNTRKLRQEIRAAIMGAGFTCPTATDASENTRAADGTEQHIVFEFEDALGVCADGD